MCVDRAAKNQVSGFLVCSLTRGFIDSKSVEDMRQLDCTPWEEHTFLSRKNLTPLLFPVVVQFLAHLPPGWSQRMDPISSTSHSVSQPSLLHGTRWTLPKWCWKVQAGMSGYEFARGCGANTTRVVQTPHLFLPELEVGIWDPGVGRAGSSWGLSGGCVVGHVLPVSSRCRPSVCVYIFISSSYKDPSLMGSGPTLMTSLTFIRIPITPLLRITSHSPLRISSHPPNVSETSLTLYLAEITHTFLLRKHSHHPSIRWPLFSSS